MMAKSLHDNYYLYLTKQFSDEGGSVKTYNFLLIKSGLCTTSLTDEGGVKATFKKVKKMKCCSNKNCDAISPEKAKKCFKCNSDLVKPDTQIAPGAKMLIRDNVLREEIALVVKESEFPKSGVVTIEFQPVEVL